MQGYNYQKIRTKDGSYTLFVKELNEHYHSVNGAVTESLHVFIKNGLKLVETNFNKKENLKILEVGFGTGLNALLTAICTNKVIEYNALEPYPLKDMQFLTLPRIDIGGYDFSSAEIIDLFDKIHCAEWDRRVKINKNFSLKKYNQKVEAFIPETKYNLAYYDAFAPQVQPELWKKSIFEKLYNSMNDNAIITTYCAKGQVRRDWQEIGFKVERLPGPPGKREMLVGRK